MESLVITWRELLVVVVLVLAVYIAEVLLLMRFGGKRRWGGGKSKTQGVQSAELEVFGKQLAGLNDRLDKLEGELEEMKRVQLSTPYSQAIQLAQQGLGATQIATNCGISRGEAELIEALHKASQT